MITLNAAISDERANSYVDLNYFDDYWTNHMDQTTGATMQGLDDDVAATLLVRSCRTIDTLHFTEPVNPLDDYHLVYDSRMQQIRSVKTNYGRPQKWNYWQHLQFPTTVNVYLDGTLYIPEEIKMAQCEQAAYEYTFDTSIIATRLQGVTHDAVNVGGVAISQKIDPNGSMISPIAYNLCKPYLIRQTMRLQRA